MKPKRRSSSHPGPNDVSAIVPFFNEGNRVLTVLDTLSQIDAITEIIAVDDGSTDYTGDIICRRFPRVKLVTLPANGGKAAAVWAGLQVSHGDTILLFDADLRHLHPQDIQYAADVFFAQCYDLLILRRIGDPWIHRLMRTDIVISGQRMMRRRDLAAILAGHPKRFELEPAINDFMIRKRKRVAWVPMHCRDVYKKEKYGTFNGSIREIAMWRDFLWYRHPLWYFWHLATFCRNQAD